MRSRLSISRLVRRAVVLGGRVQRRLRGCPEPGPGASYGSAVRALQAIESSCDVTAVRHDQLRLWPLLRLLIWQRLEQPESDQAAVAWIEGGGIPRFAPDEDGLAALRAHAPLDALLFSSVDPPLEHVERQGGAFVRPISDPLHGLLSPTRRVLRLETRSRAEASTHPRSLTPAWVELVPSGRRRDEVRSLQGFEPVRRAALEATGVDLDPRHVLALVRRMRGWRDALAQVLRAARPRALLLTSYYDPFAMAVLWACREQGVRSVDVQHGLAGCYHGMYTHWGHLPTEAYELLPDVFWRWGERSHQHVVRSWGAGPRPASVIGGHPPLTRWLSGFRSPLPAELERRLSTARRVVLVTLYPQEPPLTPTLVHAMRGTPDWLWLLRLHPTQRAPGPRARLTRFLRQQQLANGELDRTNEAALYALLERTDHHVSFGSSVYAEALAFGVRSTLLDPCVLSQWEDDHREGLFELARSGEALLDAIRRHPRVEPRGDHIALDPLQAQRALEEILRASGGAP